MFYFITYFRKLLELRPDLAVPTLWSIPQTNTNFVSECLSLINEDYSENSEDEEYKPDEDDKVTDWANIDIHFFFSRIKKFIEYFNFLE